jgi:hydroxyjasmonate sulfotransferase
MSSQSQAGDHLLSKLPTREGWSDPLVMYKNYWFRPRFLESMMLLQRNGFKARPDDTILVSNPKCGTTWLKALAFTITNRSRHDFDHRHPLLSQHPQRVVPFIEILQGNKDFSHLEKLPSPRLVATHMPLSLFPESLASADCRMVYLCREPKDAFISRWHFENKILAGHRKIALEVAFDMFCEGVVENGPFWDHCLEYWRESVAKPDKVLFIKYEDMSSDPVEHVIRLAEFLGAPFSGKEKEDGVPQEVVKLCSFENLSGLQLNRTGKLPSGDNDNMVMERSAFFRKGKVGDWVNHMSQEMGRKLDQVVEERLKGSGLAFLK